jgi:DNA-binding response OmpR family regulator
MKQPILLLVEDEPLIAQDLKGELEAECYLVLIANNTAEALRLCAQHLPQLVILNFKYRHQVDGMALARLLRIRYLAKVLFITGARPQDVEVSEDFYAGHEVLYKPFTRRQLRSFLLA